MKPLKVLIVEDDEVCMLYLKDLLKDHVDIFGDICEVDSFTSAFNILNRDEKFDLSILDNKLDRRKNIFQLIDLVGRANLGLIVYTSYVRRPNIEDTLTLSADLTFYKPYEEDNTIEFIANLKKKLQLLDETTLSFITFSEKGISIKMPFENIYSVHAVASCTEFICKDGKERHKKYTQNGNLGKFDYLLNTDIFLKCERSYFVNKHLIRAIKRSEATIYFDLEGEVPPAYYANWFSEWLDKNGF